MAQLMIMLHGALVLALIAGAAHGQCCESTGGVTSGSSGISLINAAIEQGRPGPQIDPVYVVSPGLTIDWSQRLHSWINLPFLHKSGQVDDIFIRYKAKTTGMGDVVLGMEYVVVGASLKRYCEPSLPKNAFQWSLLASVELPTGEDNAKTRVARFVEKPVPSYLQPGLGSQNQAIGTLVAWTTGRWLFSADALYKRYGITRPFRPGSFTGVQASADYLLLSHLPLSAQLWLGTGLQSVSIGHSQQEGVTIDNSGGKALFLVSTAQLFLTRRLALDLRVSVPLSTDFRGGDVSLPVVTQLGLRTFFRVENNRLIW